MPFSNVRAALLAAGVLLAVSACNGTGAVPSSAPAANPDAGGSRAAVASPADTKSILKLLKKDVTIGSTVDAANGDMGPRAVTVVQNNFGKLKKGQVLVCNFERLVGQRRQRNDDRTVRSRRKLEADDLLPKQQD